MRLISITLDNYRNFTHYNLQFGKKTSILIGRNGMGKSNLLSGMVQAMSFIFSKQRDTPQYDFIRSSDQGVKQFSITDSRYADGDYCFPLSLTMKGSLEDGDDNKILNWSFEQESMKSGLKDSRFREAYREFWEYYNWKREKPVLAFFSDGFPHKDTRLTKKMKDKLESGKPLPANTGYYQWDKEQSCVNIWKQYYMQQWINNKLNPDSEKQAFVGAVNKKMVDFSMPLPDGPEITKDLMLEGLFAESRGERNNLVIEFVDGRRVPFDNLPAGYNRIFSIVLDLSCRSYLLNGNCNPEGVVFIDEIELHLHPSIAAEILQRLRRSFPKMQFIVSTHSPLVITHFNQSSDDDDDYRLYQLNREDDIYVNRRIMDLYGLDYNSGLFDYMDMPDNVALVAKYKESYRYWIRHDQDRAKKIAELIKRSFPKNTGLLNELNIH